MSVNKIILIGNVGRVEVRNIQGGGKVATVTLATTEKFKDREETEWHTVTIWNNLADHSQLCHHWRLRRKAKHLNVRLVCGSIPAQKVMVR